MSQSREFGRFRARWPIFGKEVDALLGELRPDWDALRVSRHLRSRIDAGLAREVAHLHALRARARRRFASGHLPYLTSKGLEQATAEVVADARAERIAEFAGGALVWDATCGVGSDSLALAARGARVVASDRDPLLARCAAANLERAGLAGRVFAADATRPPLAAEFVVLDPDRRAGGERSGNPKDWSPTLDETLTVVGRHRGGCVKLAPAFEPLQGLGPRAEWEWVSLDRELCEVTLWLGELVRTPGSLRTATALRRDGTRTVFRGEPCAVEPHPPERIGQATWLAEPDPAVIRAGIVGALARSFGMAPIAPGIAYLVGDRRPPVGMASAWSILDHVPLDRRLVRAMLRRHDVGPVVVKKRGHPDASALLEKRFRGDGSRPGILAVTRLERGHLALLLAKPEAPGGPMVGDEGFEPPTSSL